MEIIHGINPSVRAIVVSGYSSDPVMANFSAYGFTAIVAKPFDPTRFSSVVAAELGGR
jgi:AmiR/NasT family two-component response regulator